MLPPGWREVLTPPPRPHPPPPPPGWREVLPPGLEGGVSGEMRAWEGGAPLWSSSLWIFAAGPR